MRQQTDRVCKQTGCASCESNCDDVRNTAVDVLHGEMAEENKTKVDLASRSVCITNIMPDIIFRPEFSLILIGTKHRRPTSYGTSFAATLYVLEIK
jgi:hypothetical protein